MKDTPTPRTDKAAYSMGRSGEHRDIERWCDLLNESRKLEDELTAVTEQRDRLAEALERILEYQGRFAEEDPESIAKEALKSLAPNK